MAKGIEDIEKLMLPGSLHGTAVAFEGQGVLIVGPSGAGKSSLAMELMALGAALISDDLVWLAKHPVQSGVTYLSRPPHVRGQLMIEARGVGLLPALAGVATSLELIVNLAALETARLPEPHYAVVAGRQLRVMNKVDVPAFPAMILQYLRAVASGLDL